LLKFYIEYSEIRYIFFLKLWPLFSNYLTNDLNVLSIGYFIMNVKIYNIVKFWEVEELYN